jgi:hypothetical protein
MQGRVAVANPQAHPVDWLQPLYPAQNMLPADGHQGQPDAIHLQSK